MRYEENFTILSLFKKIKIHKEESSLVVSRVVSSVIETDLLNR